MGQERIAYGWVAERHRGHPALRQRVLTYWTRVHRRTFARYELWRKAQTGLVPASVRAVLLCIHPLEEPSWSTSAGGLGFISPPSSYIGSVAASHTEAVRALVARYGNAWPAWPVEAQLVVGAGLYFAGHTYGPPSPWSTAGACS